MSSLNAQDILRSPEYREELAAQRTYMARVYSWMTIGLLATALAALLVASSQPLMKTIFGTGLIWALVIGEVVLGLGLSVALRALPMAVAAALFLVYSLLMGVNLSVLLWVYTLSSVAGTFFITAGMFAGISVFGYVTKRSLNSLGSFCMMGLWGLIIASIVNLFIANGTMDWLISFVGVIVFTGLTAFHTQKIKESYASNPAGSAAASKGALYGAFALYLDFINLFIYMMRFMGNRRD